MNKTTYTVTAHWPEQTKKTKKYDRTITFVTQEAREKMLLETTDRDAAYRLLNIMRTKSVAAITRGTTYSSEQAEQFISATFSIATT